MSIEDRADKLAVMSRVKSLSCGDLKSAIAAALRAERADVWREAAELCGSVVRADAKAAIHSVSVNYENLVDNWIFEALNEGALVCRDLIRKAAAEEAPGTL